MMNLTANAEATTAGMSKMHAMKTYHQAMSSSSNIRNISVKPKIVRKIMNNAMK